MKVVKFRKSSYTDPDGDQLLRDALDKEDRGLRNRDVYLSLAEASRGHGAYNMQAYMSLRKRAPARWLESYSMA